MIARPFILNRVSTRICSLHLAGSSCGYIWHLRFGFDPQWMDSELGQSWPSHIRSNVSIFRGLEGGLRFVTVAVSRNGNFANVVGTGVKGGREGPLNAENRFEAPRAPSFVDQLYGLIV